MKFKIRHLTTYTFSDMVFLDPHTVRLRPKSDSTQRVESFDITIDPEPIGITNSIDLSGNDTLSLWFRGLHDHLTITSSSEVQTLRTNPYDFIITDNRVAEVPARYGKSYVEELRPYKKNYEEIADVLRNYITEVMNESGSETLSFLAQLCSSIHRDFKHMHRPEGLPRDPRETFYLKEGACRDLAALFMEGAKSQGLASRFVSGYKEDEFLEGASHLHAWAEVYLPGGGWRGYDPTTGLMVADSHVALASGVSAADAAPVTGSYRGDGISSTLNFEIDITT